MVCKRRITLFWETSRNAISFGLQQVSNVKGGPSIPTHALKTRIRATKHKEVGVGGPR